MKEYDLLWQKYLEEREFIKHHENQRTHVSNIMTAIYAGILVSIGTGTIDETIKIILSGKLVLIGALGVVFTTKISSLIKLHANRSYEYLKLFDKELTNNKIMEIQDDAKKTLEASMPNFNKIRLSKIWVLFHAILYILGLCILTSLIYLSI